MRKAKPFIRHIMVDYSTNITPFAEVLCELGCELYEDPTYTDGSDQVFFVSNRPLTYRWLLKNARRYDINVKWFKEHFDHELKHNEDLDQPCW